MLTDTHSYDGHLPPLPREPTLSLEECLAAVRALTTEHDVHRALNLLQDPAQNYDPANHLNACDVFRLAWEIVRKTECVDCFLEQLGDITRSGPCVQGRTTRLFQLISIFTPPESLKMSTSDAFESAPLVGAHSLASSGKTTLAKRLKELYDAEEYAFAWPLKKVCGSLYGLSWEQMEDPVLKVTPIPRLNGATPRYILQKFGTELIRKHHKEAIPLLPYDSLWLDLGKEWIREHADRFRVVSDARFSNEISAIREFGGYVLGIERLSCAASAGTHESEQVLFHLCDGVVTNNGTLEEYMGKIDALFSKDSAVRERARYLAALERVPAQTRANILRTRSLLHEAHERLRELREPSDEGLHTQCELNEATEQINALELELQQLQNRLPAEEAVVANA